MSVIEERLKSLEFEDLRQIRVHEPDFAALDSHDARTVDVEVFGSGIRQPFEQLVDRETGVCRP